jgi:hypothetical protein
MENISLTIIILFSITVVAAVWLFFKSANYSKNLMLIVGAWIVMQSVLGLVGFYTNWTSLPPRFPFLIGPPVVAILVVLMTKAGRRFIDSLNLGTLTILSVIRIPVEITLYYLLLAGLIPQSMTFEGTNLDIISGITAPVVYYFVFVAKKLNPKILLAWNFLCLGLLLNVVITAILSAPTPFQRLAFDQPNVGIGYFPFVLLPAVVVPIVLLSHMASIRQLMRSRLIPQSNSASLKAG